MNRRNFIKTTGTLAVSLSMANAMSENISDDGDALVAKLVKQNDDLFPNFINQTVKEKNHKWFGGVKNSHSIPNPSSTGGWIKTLASAFVSPLSQYYHSNEILDLLSPAAQYMLNVQHDDGTIDLYSTNFHSPPDTGFVLENVVPAYSILLKDGSLNSEKAMDTLKQFILNAADALSVGGIHTPNHRWVVTRALARCNSLFPNKIYLDRINEWLNEKIDIDPDGQFTEKSSTIYSPLTDRCLITIAQELNKPEYYDPVRKNLDMTMYYVHPDGEVVTEASKRQDQYQRGSMHGYYFPYRFLAQLDHNGQFASMAKSIENTSIKRLTSSLVYFIENPTLKEPLPPKLPLPTHYRKIFSYSNLARIRDGKKSATILADNTTFFSYRNGTAALEAVRFCGAFFGKGQFSSPKLEYDGNIYRLKQKLAGPYYQPFPKEQLAEDGNWDKMPRSLRPQSEVQHYLAEIILTEHDSSFNIHFAVTGTDNVPVAIELGFRYGGKLDGVEPVKNIANSYLFNGKQFTYKFENDVIKVSPGQTEHKWTQLRGAKPKLNSDSVYITGYTPFEYDLRIY